MRQSAACARQTRKTSVEGCRCSTRREWRFTHRSSCASSQCSRRLIQTHGRSKRADSQPTKCNQPWFDRNDKNWTSNKEGVTHRCESLFNPAAVVLGSVCIFFARCIHTRTRAHHHPARNHHTPAAAPPPHQNDAKLSDSITALTCQELMHCHDWYHRRRARTDRAHRFLLPPTPPSSPGDTGAVVVPKTAKRA